MTRKDVLQYTIPSGTPENYRKVLYASQKTSTLPFEDRSHMLDMICVREPYKAVVVLPALEASATHTPRRSRGESLWWTASVASAGLVVVLNQQDTAWFSQWTPTLSS